MRAMKVKELILKLQNLDPELEVIIQKDPEGNGYSPMSGAEIGQYLPDSPYSGYCIHPDDLPDLDEETYKQLETVVIFWPIN